MKGVAKAAAGGIDPAGRVLDITPRPGAPGPRAGTDTRGRGMNSSTTVRNVLRNLDRRHLIAIILSVFLSAAAIGYIGNMLYQSTRAELELRGEIDVIKSAERFDEYLVVDKNALLTAARGVNQMLLAQARTETILGYLVVQSDRMADAVAESFTGLYGWIRMEFLDGAGWVPDADFVATERPWFKAAVASPEEIVFVDPYVDENTGDVMITIAKLLDDGESVIALDIGLEGVQEITEEIAADIAALPTSEDTSPATWSALAAAYRKGVDEA